MKFVNIQKHPMTSHVKHMGLYVFVRGIFSSFLNLHDIQWKRKIPVWNVQTHLLLTSNDVVFEISHWKSIKYNDILHHFNARLETLWYLSTFIKDSIYWKMSAAQNWIWPRSPSLRDHCSAATSVCCNVHFSLEQFRFTLFIMHWLSDLRIACTCKTCWFRQ